MSRSEERPATREAGVVQEAPGGPSGVELARTIQPLVIEI